MESRYGQGPLVIHIQDLHCNYEVQMNISRMLDWLAKYYGLRLVMVEGASLPVNVMQLRTFPDQAVKREVGDYFVRQGKLTGPEYCAAVSSRNLRLEGIETAELYQANRKVAEYLLSDEAQGYCADMQDLLDACKTKIYNARLLGFDRSRTAFRQGRLGLPAYCAHLCRTAESFRADLSAFPNLAQYARRASADFAPGIDAERLYAEIGLLDESLRQSLYDREQQRELDRMQARLDLIARLVNLSATADDLRALRSRPEDYSVKALADFARTCAGEETAGAEADVLNLQPYIAAAADFYRTADQRSLHFVSNLSQRMQQRQAQIAVLITGGYHTQDVLAQLAQRGFAYASVTPRVEHQDVLNPYFALLRDKRTPLDKWLAQSQVQLAVESYLPQTADTETVPVAQRLSSRELVFGQTLDLYLKLRAVARIFLAQGSQALPAAYRKLLQGYSCRIGNYQFELNQLKLYPDRILSFHIAQQARHLLAVIWGGNVLPSEAIPKGALDRATIGQASFALMDKLDDRELARALSRAKGDSIIRTLSYRIDYFAKGWQPWPGRILAGIVPALATGWNYFTAGPARGRTLHLRLPSLLLVVAAGLLVAEGLGLEGKNNSRGSQELSREIMRTAADQAGDMEQALDSIRRLMENRQASWHAIRMVWRELRLLERGAQNRLQIDPAGAGPIQERIYRLLLEENFWQEYLKFGKASAVEISALQKACLPIMSEQEFADTLDRLEACGKVGRAEERLAANFPLLAQEVIERNGLALESVRSQLHNRSAHDIFQCEMTDVDSFTIGNMKTSFGRGYSSGQDLIYTRVKVHLLQQLQAGKLPEEVGIIVMGASHGVHGYEVAMACADAQRESGRRFQAKIIITDAQWASVDSGKRGVYKQHVFEPDFKRKSYFIKRPDDYTIVPAQDFKNRGIKLEFRKVDLLNDRDIENVKAGEAFQLVVAQNLHYGEDDLPTMTRAFANMERLLGPDGYCLQDYTLGQVLPKSQRSSLLDLLRNRLRQDLTPEEFENLYHYLLIYSTLIYTLADMDTSQIAGHLDEWAGKRRYPFHLLSSQGLETTILATIISEWPSPEKKQVLFRWFFRQWLAFSKEIDPQRMQAIKAGDARALMPEIADFVPDVQDKVAEFIRGQQPWLAAVLEPAAKETTAVQEESKPSLFRPEEAKAAEIGERITWMIRDQIKAYRKRFLRGVRNSRSARIPHFADDFDVSLFIPDSKVPLGEALLQDSRDGYWLPKGKHPGVLRSLVRRESAAWLIGHGIANLPEIRRWNDFAARLDAPGPREDAYLTRAVMPGNLEASDLASQDPAAAFAAIFVADILFRLEDPHPANFAFWNNVPVGIDRDRIFNYEKYAGKDGWQQYLLAFLDQKVLRFAVFWTDDSQFKNGIRASLQQPNLKKKISKVRETVTRYGLGAGVVAAEMLEKSNLEKAIIAFKAVGHIEELLKKAGYAGEELQRTAEFFRANQASLGRDVDEIWEILTGAKAGFAKLDAGPSAAASTPRRALALPGLLSVLALEAAAWALGLQQGGWPAALALGLPLLATAWRLLPFLGLLRRAERAYGREDFLADAAQLPQAMWEALQGAGLEIEHGLRLDLERTEIRPLPTPAWRLLGFGGRASFYEYNTKTGKHTFYFHGSFFSLPSSIRQAVIAHELVHFAAQVQRLQYKNRAGPQGRWASLAAWLLEEFRALRLEARISGQARREREMRSRYLGRLENDSQARQWEQKFIHDYKLNSPADIRQARHWLATISLALDAPAGTTLEQVAQILDKPAVQPGNILFVLQQLAGIAAATRSSAPAALQLTDEILIFARRFDMLPDLKVIAEVARAAGPKRAAEAVRAMHRIYKECSVNYKTAKFRDFKEITAQLAPLARLVRTLGPDLGVAALKTLGPLIKHYRLAGRSDELPTVIRQLPEWYADIAAATRKSFAAIFCLAIIRARCERNLEHGQAGLATLPEMVIASVRKQCLEHGQDSVPELLRQEPALERMAVKDTGGAPNNALRLAGILLDLVPGLRPDRPADFPRMPELARPEDLRRMTPAALAAKAGLAGKLRLVRALGRGLLFVDGQGTQMVVKWNKAGESNALLEYECRAFGWGNQYNRFRAAPRPVMMENGDHRFVFEFADSGYQDQIRRELDLASRQSLQMHGYPLDVNPEAVCTAYVLEAASRYATYLGPGENKTWLQFTAAALTAAKELGHWSRLNVIHSSLGALFHQLAGRGARSYAPTAGLDELSLSPFTAGRMADYPSAAAAPNLASDGTVRDYKYVNALADWVQGPAFSEPELEFILKQHPDQAANFFMLEFLSRYPLLVALLTGAWQEANRWQGLDWQQAASLQNLAQFMQEIYAAVAEGCLGRTRWKQVQAWVLEKIDWIRMARQMAFFLSPAYLPFFRPGGQRDPGQTAWLARTMFGLRPEAFEIGEYRRGTWDDALGFIGEAGESRQGQWKILGTVNGPNFLTELLTANAFIFGLGIAKLAWDENHWPGNWARAWQRWLAALSGRTASLGRNLGSGLKARLRLQWKVPAFLLWVFSGLLVLTPAVGQNEDDQHAYVPLKPSECLRFYRQIAAEWTPPQNRYLENFALAIERAEPAMSLDLPDKLGMPWPGPEDFFKHGMVRDEADQSLWLVKKYEPRPEGRGAMHNDRRQEKLTYLLSQGVAALTEIRYLNDRQAKSLGLEGDAEDYYLTKVVLSWNMPGHLLSLEERRQSLAMLVVFSIWTRKIDHWLANIGFAEGRPVAVDHDGTNQYKDYPATPVGFRRFAAQFVRHAVAETFRFLSRNPTYQRALIPIIEGVAPARILKSERELIDQFRLDAGWVEANGLTPENIAGAVAMIRSIPAEVIEAKIKNAGYKHPSEIRALKEYIIQNQQTLQADVESMIAFITGRRPDISQETAWPSGRHSYTLLGQQEKSRLGPPSREAAKQNSAGWMGYYHWFLDKFVNQEELLPPEEILDSLRGKALAQQDENMQGIVLRDEKGVLWKAEALAQIDSQEGRLERLKYLLAEKIMNAAEVRLLSQEEIAGIPGFDPARTYKAVRLNMPGNFKSEELPVQDFLAAMVRRFVVDVFLRRAEAGIEKTEFTQAGYPVETNYSRALDRARFPATPAGFQAFFAAYLKNSILLPFKNMTHDPLFLKEMTVVENEPDINRQLESAKRLVKRFGLDQGLASAAGNLHLMAETVAQIKTLDVRALAVEAGYAGEELEEIASYLRSLQSTAARNVMAVVRVFYDFNFILDVEEQLSGGSADAEPDIAGNYHWLENLAVVLSAGCIASAGYFLLTSGTASAWIQVAGGLMLGSGMMGWVVWGAHLLLAAAAWMAARATLPEKFRQDPDRMRKAEEFLAGEARVRINPALRGWRFAYTARRAGAQPEVSLAAWLLAAPETSPWLHRLNGLLLPIILAHERSRVRGRRTIGTYADKLLNLRPWTGIKGRLSRDTDFSLADPAQRQRPYQMQISDLRKPLEPRGRRRPAVTKNAEHPRPLTRKPNLLHALGKIFAFDVPERLQPRWRSSPLALFVLGGLLLAAGPAKDGACTFADRREMHSVYETLKGALTPQFLAYARRFLEGVHDQDFLAEFGFVQKKGSAQINKFLPSLHKAFPHGLVRKAGRYWALKQKPREDVRYEILVSLLSAGRANVGQARPLSAADAKDLGVKNRDAYFLHRLVAKGNLGENELPDRDPESAFSGLLVAALLFRQHDPWYQNFAYLNEIPVAMDFDRPEEANGQEDIREILLNLLRNKLNLPLRGWGEGEPFYSSYQALLTRMKSSLDVYMDRESAFSRHPFSRGLLAAEMLNPAAIREHIRRYKELTREQIVAAARQAGCPAEEAEETAAFIAKNLRTLGEDMDRLWYALTSEYARFDNLDKPEAPMHWVPRDEAKALVAKAKAHWAEEMRIYQTRYEEALNRANPGKRFETIEGMDDKSLPLPLVQDKQGKYWFLKHSESKSRQQDFPRERLAYTLLKLTNVAPVRKVTDEEARALGLPNNGQDYYLSRAVFEGNFDADELPARDPGQAWAELLAGLILIKDWDFIQPHIYFQGGLPVKIDFNKSSDPDMYPATPEGRRNFLLNFLDMKGLGSLHIWIRGIDYTRRCLDLQEQGQGIAEAALNAFQEIHLGAGLIAAEGLTWEKLEAAAKKFQSLDITPAMTAGAGYTGDAIQRQLDYVKSNQAALMDDVRQFWDWLEGATFVPKQNPVPAAGQAAADNRKALALPGFLSAAALDMLLLALHLDATSWLGLLVLALPMLGWVARIWPFQNLRLPSEAAYTQTDFLADLQSLPDTLQFQPLPAVESFQTSPWHLFFGFGGRASFYDYNARTGQHILHFHRNFKSLPLPVRQAVIAHERIHYQEQLKRWSQTAERQVASNRLTAAWNRLAEEFRAVRAERRIAVNRRKSELWQIYMAKISRILQMNRRADIRGMTAPDQDSNRDTRFEPSDDMHTYKRLTGSQGDVIYRQIVAEWAAWQETYKSRFMAAVERAHPHLKLDLKPPQEFALPQAERVMQQGMVRDQVDNSLWIVKKKRASTGGEDVNNPYREKSTWLLARGLACLTPIRLLNREQVKSLGLPGNPEDYYLSRVVIKENLPAKDLTPEEQDEQMAASLVFSVWVRKADRSIFNMGGSGTQPVDWDHDRTVRAWYYPGTPEGFSKWLYDFAHHGIIKTVDAWSRNDEFKYTIYDVDGERNSEATLEHAGKLIRQYRLDAGWTEANGLTRKNIEKAIAEIKALSAAEIEARIRAAGYAESGEIAERKNYLLGNQQHLGADLEAVLKFIAGQDFELKALDEQQPGRENGQANSPGETDTNQRTQAAVDAGKDSGVITAAQSLLAYHRPSGWRTRIKDMARSYLAHFQWHWHSSPLLILLALLAAGSVNAVLSGAEQEQPEYQRLKNGEVARVLNRVGVDRVWAWNEYIRTFTGGMQQAGPARDLDAQGPMPMPGLQAQELAPLGLARGHGKIWVIHKHDPILEDRDPKRALLAAGLADSIAPTAEIMRLSQEQARALKLPGRAGDYYLAELIDPGELPEEKLDPQRQAETLAGIFAFKVWVRDPVWGIPGMGLARRWAATGHDRALDRHRYPHTPRGFLRFQVEMLKAAVLDLFRDWSGNSEFHEKCDPVYRAVDAADAAQEANTLIRLFGLGEGFKAAQGLTPENLDQAIRKIQAITPEQIETKIRLAGYQDPDEAGGLKKFLLENQASLAADIRGLLDYFGRPATPAAGPDAQASWHAYRPVSQVQRKHILLEAGIRPAALRTYLENFLRRVSNGHEFAVAGATALGSVPYAARLEKACLVEDELGNFWEVIPHDPGQGLDGRRERLAYLAARTAANAAEVRWLARQETAGIPGLDPGRRYFARRLVFAGNVPPEEWTDIQKHQALARRLALNVFLRRPAAIDTAGFSLDGAPIEQEFGAALDASAYPATPEGRQKFLHRLQISLLLEPLAPMAVSASLRSEIQVLRDANDWQARNDQLQKLIRKYRLNMAWLSVEQPEEAVLQAAAAQIQALDADALAREAGYEGEDLREMAGYLRSLQAGLKEDIRAAFRALAGDDFLLFPQTGRELSTNGSRTASSGPYHWLHNLAAVMAAAGILAGSIYLGQALDLPWLPQAANLALMAAAGFGLAVWGSHLLLAGAGWLLSRLTLPPTFPTDPKRLQTAVNYYNNNEIQVRTDPGLQGLRLAHTRAHASGGHTVFLAPWLLAAKKESPWLYRLNSLLLPMILAHESWRVKHYSTGQVYLAKLLAPAGQPIFRRVLKVRKFWPGLRWTMPVWVIFSVLGVFPGHNAAAGPNEPAPAILIGPGQNPPDSTAAVGEKIFPWYVLVMFENALNDSDQEVRENAAKSLGSLAQALAAQPEAEHLLRKYWTPLYQQAMIDGDANVRNEAVKNLDLLAQTLAGLPEGQALLTDFWEPLLQQALKDPNLDVRMHAAGSLDGLALAIEKRPDAMRLAKTVWLPLYRQVLAEPDTMVKVGAGDTLGSLALALAAQPDGQDLLKTLRKPLYQAAAVLGDLAQAMAIQPDDQSLLEAGWEPPYQKAPQTNDFVETGGRSESGESLSLETEQPGGDGALHIPRLPLDEQALNDANGHAGTDAAPGLEIPDRALAGQSETPDFPDIGGLARAAAGLPKAGNFLRKSVWPVYQKALNHEKSSNRKIAAANLGLFAQAALSQPDALAEDAGTLWKKVKTHADAGHENDLAEIAAQSASVILGASGRDDPTGAWVLAADILAFLKNRNLRPDPLLANTLARRLCQALGRKGRALDAGAVVRAYFAYFDRQAPLPRSHRGPKDLLGHMILDFLLCQHGLPGEYARRLRETRRSPAYAELLPLLNRLAESEPVFLEAIRGFSAWVPEGQGKPAKAYWGEVSKLLETAARDWPAFKSLGVAPEVTQMLRGFRRPADEVKAAGGKTKLLQRMSAEMQRIIPEFVETVLHVKVEKINWPQPTEKEMNVLLYVARHRDYVDREHPLNQCLRAYYRTRLEGGTPAAADAAFWKIYPTLPGMKELLEPLKAFLDKSGTRLRAPGTVDYRIFLGNASPRDQLLWGNWMDAVRHLHEQLPFIEGMDARRELEEILGGIEKIKKPSEADVKQYLPRIREWTAKYESRIPGGPYGTILDHLQKVAALLQEPDGKPEQAVPGGNHAASTEIVITTAAGPIETLHLGWPWLGGSCLDIVTGGYGLAAAGYVLNPALPVVFFKDTQDSPRPPARVSLALDVKHGLLVAISPVKSSSPYDFQKAVGEYLQQWARMLKVRPVLPLNLGYKEQPGQSYLTAEVEVEVPQGLLPLYSDLTGECPGGWQGKITGWVGEGPAAGGTKQGSVFAEMTSSLTGGDYNLLQNFLAMLASAGVVAAGFYFGGAASAPKWVVWFGSAAAACGLIALPVWAWHLLLAGAARITAGRVLPADFEIDVQRKNSMELFLKKQGADRVEFSETMPLFALARTSINWEGYKEVVLSRWLVAQGKYSPFLQRLLERLRPLILTQEAMRLQRYGTIRTYLEHIPWAVQTQLRRIIFWESNYSLLEHTGQLPEVLGRGRKRNFQAYRERLAQGVQEAGKGFPFSRSADEATDRSIDLQMGDIANCEIVREKASDKIWVMNHAAGPLAPGRARLAYLLAGRIANFAEAKKPDPSGPLARLRAWVVRHDYLEQLVSPEQEIPGLPQATAAEAFAGLFVASIFLRIWDFHQMNVAFAKNDVPVAIDSDRALEIEKYPHSPDGFAKFAYDYLFAKIIYFARLWTTKWRLESALRTIDRVGNPNTRLDMFGYFIQHYGLGRGLIKAEMLTPDKLRKFILEFKRLGNVRGLVVQAGFEGEQVGPMVDYIERSRNTLGRDVNAIWKVLTGEDAGLDQLDREESTRARQPEKGRNGLTPEEAGAAANHPLLEQRAPTLGLMQWLLAPGPGQGRILPALAAVLAPMRWFAGWLLRLYILAGRKGARVDPEAALTRLQKIALLAPDALAARTLDPDFFLLKPLSALPAAGMALRRLSLLGTYRLEQGRPVIYIPDRLLEQWPQGSRRQQATRTLFELSVRTQALKYFADMSWRPQTGADNTGMAKAAFRAEALLLNLFLRAMVFLPARVRSLGQAYCLQQAPLLYLQVMQERLPRGSWFLAELSQEQAIHRAYLEWSQRPDPARTGIWLTLWLDRLQTRAAQAAPGTGEWLALRELGPAIAGLWEILPGLGKSGLPDPAVEGKYLDLLHQLGSSRTEKSLPRLRPKPRPACGSAA